MRLDHLLSKEEEVESQMCFTVELSSTQLNNHISGVDALVGNTRSHPEHDGKDLSGRWYFAGDGTGEQVAAGIKKESIKLFI